MQNKNYENKNVTMKDIAKIVDVSVMTVSKALNDKPGISLKTSAKIKKIAKELNYKPNLIAKQLRLDKSRTIGVVMADSSEMAMAKVLRGLIDGAESAGYGLIISNTDGQHKREKKAIELLLAQRIDGLILVASTLVDDKESSDWLKGLTIPIVLLMREDIRNNIDSVLSDNIRGGYLIGSHICQQGCKDIAILSLYENSSVGNDRVMGIRSALIENNMTIDKNSIFYSIPNIDVAYQHTKEILVKTGNIDALICGCDIIAIGAMRAILESGRKIPDDICVTGFDGIELSEFLMVPLTTVEQMLLRIGKKGMEMIISRIKDPDKPSQKSLLNVELLERASSLKR